MEPQGCAVAFYTGSITRHDDDIESHRPIPKSIHFVRSLHVKKHNQLPSGSKLVVLIRVFGQATEIHPSLSPSRDYWLHCRLGGSSPGVLAEIFVCLASLLPKPVCSQKGPPR